VRPRPVLAVLVLGLLTFGVVFSFLAFSPSRAEPGQAAPTEISTPSVLAVATDSLEPRIAADDLAVGVPIAGSEGLLRNVQPGDRLDIVASFAAPADGQPLTAVLVRGATVLQSATQAGPLLVEMPAADAVMMVHVLLRGTHLGYVLWPANGTLPAATPAPIDEQAARAALGLSQPTVAPTATSLTAGQAAAPTQAATTAVPSGQAAPPSTTSVPPGVVRPASGFLYQVQPNDTWASIAAIFGLPVDDLRRVNESASDEPVPGTLVFIPRSS
jgi:LysM repeat protein